MAFLSNLYFLRDKLPARNYADKKKKLMNSTYFGLLAEFGEAHIPLEKIALKYFGLSPTEAKRRAPIKNLPCRVFRLSGQKSPWLVSIADLAELIDKQREKASERRSASAKHSFPPRVLSDAN